MSDIVAEIKIFNQFSIMNIVKFVLNLVEKYDKSVVKKHQLMLYKKLIALDIEEEDKQLFWAAMYIFVGSENENKFEIKHFKNKAQQRSILRFYDDEECHFDHQYMCGNSSCCGNTILYGNSSIGCCCSDSNPLIHKCSTCDGDNRVNYNSDMSYFMWKHGCTCDEFVSAATSRDDCNDNDDYDDKWDEEHDNYCPFDDDTSSEISKEERIDAYNRNYWKDWDN